MNNLGVIRWPQCRPLVPSLPRKRCPIKTFISPGQSFLCWASLRSAPTYQIEITQNKKNTSVPSIGLGAIRWPQCRPLASMPLVPRLLRSAPTYQIEATPNKQKNLNAVRWPRCRPLVPSF